MNNLLEYLDRSYFLKPHMGLLKEHKYAVCEAVSKHLEYLDNQVTRATEAQNMFCWYISCSSLPLEGTHK